MEFFGNLQKDLRILGMYQPEPSKKLKLFIYNITCIILLFSLFLSTLWYFFLAEKPFIELVKSIFSVMIALLNFFSFVTFILQKSKFSRLFDDIKRVVQKGMQNEDSIQTYREMIISIDKWTYVFCIAARTIIISSFGSNILFSYWGFFTSENYKFHYVLPASTPYDWTWWGFLCGEIYQIAAFFLINLLCGCILSVWYVTCTAIETFAKDINLQLNGLNGLCSGSSNKQLKIKEKLCNTFELQGSMIEIAAKFSDVYSIIILAYFLWGIISICTSLAIFQFMLNKGQISVDILLSPLFLGATLIQIYLFCYFGNSLSSAQEDIADCFYQLNWHELPVHMQKLFLLPIMVAQNPVHMYAFGSIECTSETFTKIVNRAFSLFTLLRQFEF